MQEIVANVDHLTFGIEKMLEQQIGAQTLAFPGMDKSGSAICTFFLTSACSKGSSCPFRHIKGERAVVCKHWLRGLCKKGDDCEFLHEFDMSKMPECYFFSRFGECGNKECPFLHIDPEKKIKVCPWYDRGFCRHGAMCKNRHVRRVMCVNYLCGFCLDGPACKFVHPKFDLPVLDSLSHSRGKMTFTCHRCNEVGHKAITCPRLGTGITSVGDILNVTPVLHQSLRPYLSVVKHDLRPLDQVTCFKLIQEAIRNGDAHQSTMELADYWLLEKDLIHKLFKVLVPRYRLYETSYTLFWNIPIQYPGRPIQHAVLELKGNPWPPVVSHVRDVNGSLLNVLLDKTRQNYLQNAGNCT